MRRRRQLDEAAGTGSPTLALAPYDDRAGHGYGHTGGARTIGRDMKQQGSFPYKDPGNTLRDVYPELFHDEDELGDSFTDEERDELTARLGLANTVSDQLGQRMNVRDRTSFVGADSRLTMASYDPRVAVGGDLTLERIYTVSARDNPMTPSLAGTTRGWSGAPDWEIEGDEEDPMFTHDAIDPDIKAVKDADRSVKRSRRAMSASGRFV